MSNIIKIFDIKKLFVVYFAINGQITKTLLILLVYLLSKVLLIWIVSCLYQTVLSSPCIIFIVGNLNEYSPCLFLDSSKYCIVKTFPIINAGSA